MKSFTDIEQSEKLAEILPIESADMWWAERYEGHTTMDYQYVVEETPYYYLSLKKPSIDNYSQDAINDIPCWSLAALLDVLQKAAYSIDEDANVMLDSYKTVEWHLGINNSDLELITASNPVDACVEMILKLHEENLI